MLKIVFFAKFQMLIFAVATLMIDYSFTASIDNAIIPSALGKSEIAPPEPVVPKENNPHEHLREILKTAEKSLQNITNIVNTTSLLLDNENAHVRDAVNDTVGTDAVPPKVPLLTDLLEFLDKENRQVYSIIQNLIKQIRSRLPPFLRPNNDE